MKPTFHAVVVILAAFSFVWASSYVLVVQGISLTQDEAIGISMKTSIIRYAQERGYDVGMSDVKASHWSVDFIRSEKLKGSSDVMQRLPDDHGVWRVFWNIGPPGLYVLHFIDELTGQILYESWFVA
jgi:hypothetical protein